ncbi:hypothetical protein [Dactylosporangium sp. NPDC000521]|uniref:hypothetical protein n=1 Tax=Dactylosporangium sp. NPDC000521 TaxID=3363975 RepID=UPI0036928911
MTEPDDSLVETVIGEHGHWTGVLGAGSPTAVTVNLSAASERWMLSHPVPQQVDRIAVYDAAKGGHGAAGRPTGTASVSAVSSAAPAVHHCVLVVLAGLEQLYGPFSQCHGVGVLAELDFIRNPTLSLQKVEPTVLGSQQMPLLGDVAVSTATVATPMPSRAAVRMRS